MLSLDVVESEEALHFYKEHWHPSVMERDPQQLMLAIEHDRLIGVKQEGSLVAICGVFADEHGIVREVGGLRVTLNGCGLQSKLMAVQVITQYLLDPPKNANPILAITAFDNAASRRSIEKIGFDIVQNLPTGMMIAAGIGSISKDNSYYTIDLTPEALTPAARLLEPLIYDPVIRSKDGTVYPIELRHPIFAKGLLRMFIEKELQ